MPNGNKLQAVIFDFDNTIAPTDGFQVFRTKHDTRGLEQYLREQEFKMFDGIGFLLNDLCHNQIPVAIVTNSPRWYVDCLLEHLGIQNSFDVIISYNDVVDEIKPSPKGILLALEAMKLGSAQNIIYIGDDKNDVIAAYRAGVVPIIGRWTTSKEPISYMPFGVLSTQNLVDASREGLHKFELTAEKCSIDLSSEGKKTNVLPLDEASKLVYYHKDAVIFSFGRYFPLSSEASAKLHNNHALTKQISEKMVSDANYKVPSHWATIFRQFIGGLEIFKKIDFDIITVIPAKKGKVKRLENMLSNIQGASNEADKMFLQDLFYFEDNSVPTKTLNRFERYNQIDKALKITNLHASKIREANVIVIDDVSTSGATLSSAIKTLKSYGAKNVYGLCIAKTVSLPEDKTCPVCHTKLKINTVKNTGGQFWYCPKKDINGTYENHFIENIKEKDCSKCGRPMFKRFNPRDKSVFLGCSGYRDSKNDCSHTEKVS
ncbi:MULTISPECIES: HAD-IA family hydrolase [unclassified Psychrobacter]|uniref:HAD-IA family hydrolase n=1 Tax=unclassified Psychrobacter TaxID=196806 RepID=UPI00159B49E2|nr:MULTISPECIES: HAD-IA family hydrolase [unclassified Psychrobacter]MDA5134591.1 HAD-IA family hydrolase [Psychrobacter sp. ANT_H3]QJS05644.1 HAD hydrolase, IA, variant 1 family protein [Psychrobacter sp.]